MHCQYLVKVAVEFSEVAYVPPHALIRRVKNVGSIKMIMYAGFRFIERETIASYVISFFNYQDIFFEFAGYPFCQNRAKESASYN